MPMVKDSLKLRGHYLFFWLLVGVLALGQLQRITINETISFYIHDLLIVGWSIAILFIQREFFLKKIKTFFSTSPKWVLSLLILIVISILIGWAGSLLQHQFSLAAPLYLIRYLTYLFFGYCCWQFWPQLKINRQDCRDYFFGFGLLILIGGYAQYIFSPDLRWLQLLGWDNHYYRLAGTLFDPAFAGLILSWWFIWFLLNHRYYFKFKNQSWPFFLKIILGILFLVAIYLTYSRAAIVALVVGVMVWAWRSFSDPRRRGRSMILIILLAALPVLVIYFALPHQGNDSTNFFRLNSLSVRAEETKILLSDLQPWQYLFGRGAFVSVDYDQVWLKYQDQSIRRTAAFGDNLFLTIFNFGGFLGLGIFIFSIIKITLYFFQKKSPLLIFWLSWLVNAQFNNSFFQPFIVLTFILLILIFRSTTSDKSKV